jgi:hypothetical protein
MCVYLGGSPVPFSPAASSLIKKKQKKFMLNPEHFLDLKLKVVELYNHNTVHFIFELPNSEVVLSPIMFWLLCVHVRALLVHP